MCCLVALLLLLSIASMPIKVSAEQKENDRDVYFSGGGVITFAAGTAAFVVMLNAARNAVSGFAINAAEGITNLWNSLSSSVRSWFNDDAIEIFEGTPVRVPENVKEELEEKGSEFGVSFPAEDLYLRPITGTLDLSALTFEDVYAMSVQELMVYNLTLLQTMQLALTDFRYDSYSQYRVMHDAFYEQIVETRLALNNTLQASSSGIYDRLGSVATRMETQFVETRQALLNKISTVSSDIYSNISLVRSQIVEQLIQTRGAVTNSLSGIKSAIDSIAADVGSLAGSKDDDQVAIVPPFSVPNLKSKITSIADGFKRLFQRPDEDDDNPSIPWLPFSLFSKDDGSNGFFLSMFDDSEFINTLKGFFDFVASLWLLFPLAIRYFITFGFGTPIIVGLAKMFAG